MASIAPYAVEIERMLAANASPAQLSRFYLMLNSEERERCALALIGLVMTQKCQLERKV